MTYFPEPVFRNITSYLLDPEFFKKRHAEVWQKIRVKRVMESTMGFEEDEESIRDCRYFVYIYDPDIGVAGYRTDFTTLHQLQS